MQSPNPIAISGLILSTVTPLLNLDPADRDVLTQELQWLFSAAEHFLQFRRGDIDPNQPIAAPTPPGAAKLAAEADNRLLLNGVREMVKDWSASAGFRSLEDKVETQLALWEAELQTGLHALISYLNYLNGWLDQETRFGEAGKYDDRLQNNIKGVQIKIAEELQELAALMSQLYGLAVATPGQLVELLAE
jgi:hypothetical protein